MAMSNLGKGERGVELKIVCAWCGKDMGEKDGKGVEGISHGLCKECSEKLGVKRDNSGSTEDESD